MISLVFYHEFFVTDKYWNAVYYPKGNKGQAAIFSPKFDNKEECIAWALNERGLRPEDKDVPLADLWECNKDCRLSPDIIDLIHSPLKYKQDLVDNSGRVFYICADGGFDGADWLRGDF